MSVRPWFCTTTRRAVDGYRCYFFEGLDGLSKLLLRPAHWHDFTKPPPDYRVKWCRCQRPELVDSHGAHARGDLLEAIPTEGFRPLTARARAELDAASAGFRLIFEDLVAALEGRP